jgi:hypothetical protein
MSTVVVIPGGFHPFHAGHKSLYDSAIKAFPDADVYIAATNDTKTRPFPFSIKEKLAKVAGVSPGHFVQVKSPFQPREITSKFDPAKDILIFVRSEKDKNESPTPGGTKKDGSPNYFQPYAKGELQPFGKHAYMAYLPTVEFGPGLTSATEIREAWPTLDERRKTALVMSLYPATQKNPRLAKNVVQLLDLGMGGEHIKEARIFDMNLVNLFYKIRNSRDAARLLYKNVPKDKVNKVINTLCAKYKVDPNDFEMVPVDQPYGHRIDEDIQVQNNIANVVYELLQTRKPEVFIRYGDRYVMDIILDVAADAPTKTIPELGLETLQRLKREIKESQDKKLPWVLRNDPLGDKIEQMQDEFMDMMDQNDEKETDDVDENMIIGCCPNEDKSTPIGYDQEVARMYRFAQQHYPNMKDKQDAFVKYVIHALKHSEEDDRHQDQEIDDLEHKVDQLQQQTNVTESADYLEEK